MPLGKRIVSSGTLRNSFDRRSMVVGGIQGGLGLLLAGRLAYLAVFENEKYQLEAESNRVNLSLIPPRRGWILDRNNSREQDPRVAEDSEDPASRLWAREASLTYWSAKKPTSSPLRQLEAAQPVGSYYLGGAP